MNSYFQYSNAILWFITTNALMVGLSMNSYFQYSNDEYDSLLPMQ